MLLAIPLKSCSDVFLGTPLTLQHPTWQAGLQKTERDQALGSASQARWLYFCHFEATQRETRGRRLFPVSVLAAFNILQRKKKKSRMTCWWCIFCHFFMLKGAAGLVETKAFPARLARFSFACVVRAVRALCVLGQRFQSEWCGGKVQRSAPDTSPSPLPCLLPPGKSLVCRKPRTRGWKMRPLWCPVRDGSERVVEFLPVLYQWPGRKL